MRRTPRSLLSASAVALLLVAASCGSDDGSEPAAAADPAPTETAAQTETAPSAGGVRVVPAEEAAELLAADPAPAVIDVRTPEEFAEGHLDGAVLIDVNSPDFEARIAELDRDQPYVLYCRSGNRSATARAVMADLGFTDVADVEGGIAAWVAAGLPVVTS